MGLKAEFDAVLIDVQGIPRRMILKVDLLNKGFHRQAVFGNRLDHCVYIYDHDHLLGDEDD